MKKTRIVAAVLYALGGQAVLLALYLAQSCWGATAFIVSTGAFVYLLATQEAKP